MRRRDLPHYIMSRRTKSMTKFETIGTQNLANSITKADARKAFEWSCKCCCERGMHLDCDRCAIAVCYRNTIAIMDDKAALEAKQHRGDTSGKNRK